MKLMTQPLQLWPDSNPRNAVAILPPAMRFLRLTQQGVEIPHFDSLGACRVARVDGNGLDRVWPHLVFNRVHELRVGFLAPHQAVTRISPKERSLGQPRNHLLSDPDPCRADCFTIETGCSRDLWPAESLVAFAVHRRRPEMLLQFPELAYVLTPREGQFDAVLDRILRDNLSTRSCSLYTVWGPGWRPAGYAGKFHLFLKIIVVERNLAPNGDWDVRLQGPAAAALARPSVGMDM
jgi:hypothetical protein